VPLKEFDFSHIIFQPETKSTMVDTTNDLKTRYNDQELDEFRIIIGEKLEKAKEDLLFYLNQMTEFSESEDAKAKGIDDGIGTAENERLSSLAARQKKLILHLENALIRIDNKVYGICRATGKLISKERLRAVPHATLSIEAKQQNLG
jgi:DnaK suppressor protein